MMTNEPPGWPPAAPSAPYEGTDAAPDTTGIAAEPQNRPKRRRWVGPIVAVVTLVVGVTVGAAATATDPTATPEYEALAAQREKLELDVQRLEARLATAEQELDVNDERSAELDEREGTLDAREFALDKRSGKLDDRESGLEEREAAVTTAEDEAAANEVTDGVWTVGVDIEPGTYRTVDPVSSSMCYWAVLRSGTNGDIVDNDIVSGGHPTVTLSEGNDFESNRCGTWRRQ